MTPSPRRLSLLVPVGLAAVTAMLWWQTAAPHGTRPLARRLAVSATRPATIADEMIEPSVAERLPRGCEPLAGVRNDDPSSAARREDLARCLEGWGWDMLRQGRAEEAMRLFRQALGQAPDRPGPLRGLGLAAVHAGRTDDAVPALEAAARAQADTEVRVLLAHLYDHRDDADRALAHLRAALLDAPGHEAARRLLDRIERTARAEAGFRREVTPHFIVKWDAGADLDSRRALRDGLAAARQRVLAQFGEVPRERVTVVLYDAAHFQDVARVHGWVTGVFDGKIRLPASVGLPARPELERILVHEYTHAVVHDLTRGRAPRWLHEGVAQALDGTRPDPMLRVPGRPTLVGLEALLADPDPARAHTAYETALWVVDDLLDRGGAPAMRALMRRLGRGESLAAAVPAVYGLALAELEGRWRRVLGG